MGTPKTVTLFLMDGTPTGKIKCTFGNWLGQVYLIPRTELQSVKNRPELQHTGTYLLIGKADDSGEDMVYVGQARERSNQKGVLGRVIEHLGDDDKAYFTHAIIVVTSDNSHGPTEISYLENAFYRLAQEAGRVQLKNSNVPGAGNVTEEKEAELNEFIEYAKIAIGSLGFRIFEALDDAQPVTAGGVPQEQEASSAEPMLFLRTRKCEARGRQASDGFVVFEGARLRLQAVPSIPPLAVNLREKYADLVSAEGVLTQNVLFNSPSIAASFIAGAPMNGRVEWKTKSGLTLKEYEEREAAEVQQN